MRVEYLIETQILLKAQMTNVKSFLWFGDYFLWYPEVMGALEPLIPFISGPARTVEQPYQWLKRLTLTSRVPRHGHDLDLRDHDLILIFKITLF